MCFGQLAQQVLLYHFDALELDCLRAGHRLVSLSAWHWHSLGGALTSSAWIPKMDHTCHRSDVLWPTAKKRLTRSWLGNKCQSAVTETKHFWLHEGMSKTATGKGKRLYWVSSSPSHGIGISQYLHEKGNVCCCEEDKSRGPDHVDAVVELGGMAKLMVGRTKSMKVSSSPIVTTWPSNLKLPSLIERRTLLKCMDAKFSSSKVNNKYTEAHCCIAGGRSIAQRAKEKEKQLWLAHHCGRTMQAKERRIRSTTMTSQHCES